MGHRIMTDDHLPGSDLFVGHSTWTLSLPPSEEIKAIISRPREPVASLGKVMGNRTTLYKYLNPHIVAVLTSNPGTVPASDLSSTPTSSKPSCGVYLIDQTKGTTIYRARVPAAAGRCDVHAAFAENWLVYHYFDAEIGGTDKTKAYKVVSVELYEGNGVDQKTRSSELSSLSQQSGDMTAFEQVYLYPHGITTMATTSTKYGMTVKDVIGGCCHRLGLVAAADENVFGTVANENGQIQSYPRRFLDPRRPKRKPTTEEQEEWLIQYDALLPDDPRRVLSHNYDVRYPYFRAPSYPYLTYVYRRSRKCAASSPRPHCSSLPRSSSPMASTSSRRGLRPQKRSTS
jgi:ER membrane protein complex subunit 1